MRRRVIACRQYIDWARNHVQQFIHTDEKLFRIGARHSQRNYRIYSLKRQGKQMIPKRLLYNRVSLHGCTVMVWAGISWDGKLELQFFQGSVKTAQYCKYVLRRSMRNYLAQHDPQRQRYVMQEDNCSVHWSRRSTLVKQKERITCLPWRGRLKSLRH